jgi:CRP-like cAMP-binding protein
VTTSLSDNLLLLRFPAAARTAFESAARIDEMPEGVKVFDADEEHDIFFPLGSVISLLHQLEDGSEIEVAMIGVEGMAGINAVLGMPRSPHTGLMQGSGRMATIPGPLFREIVNSEPELRDLLMRYAQVMMMNATQLIACNAMHVVAERLAHWLLLLHDRASGDEMTVTQEFLARMLATRRAGINEAIRSLREAGAIEHRRSRVKVIDRRRLEELSCACYEMTVAQYEKTMNFSPRPKSSETVSEKVS